MNVGIAEARDCLQMIARGVSLVPIEPVPRVARVQLVHHPIARDLGDD
jgi:hypothetical protein